MFNEMNKTVDKFDNVILSAVEPTQRMIDIVADEWAEQHKEGGGINLTPDHCSGMTQLQIDKTVEWLHNNA